MAKNLIFLALAVVGLIVIGSFVVSLLGTLVKLVFYLLVGAVVVGGGLYVLGRARRAVSGGRRRELR